MGGFVEDVVDFVEDEILDPIEEVDPYAASLEFYAGEGKNALDSLRGKDQEEALEQAAKEQELAARDQLQLGREQIAAFESAEGRAAERLAPFEQFGLDALPEVNRLLQDSGRFTSRAEALLDPQAQVEFLQNNPLFQAASEQSTREARGLAAARGGAGSGDLVEELFNRYMAQGETFIGNQFSRIGATDALLGNELNRLLTPVQVGQASAAGQAANIQGTASNVGQALSGQQSILGNMGNVGAAQAIQQGNLDAQRNQQLLSMGVGGLLGSGVLGGSGIAGGGWLGAGAGALMFSDERLKENIEFIGENSEGIKIYKYTYQNDDTIHIGPMAQELEEVKPWAVYEHESGYKMIDKRAV